MIKIGEAIYKKGQIILEDLDLPEGIILDKKEGPINELKSFSEDPVDFQRNIRENEWK
jgi:hypothetical protein